MKKLVLLLAIIGIVFSSCNGKYTIAKRKYNKGFYVNRTSGNHSNTGGLASTKMLKAVPIKNNQVEVINVTKNEARKTENSPNEEVIAAASIANKTKTNNKAFANSQKSNEIASNSGYINLYKELKPLNISKGFIPIKKSNSDSNLIVLVILCFLWWLNLIAVYIHDGKSITLNFWITLLLDFTFIGGIIFSLLVVLDVVDLK